MCGRPAAAKMAQRDTLPDQSSGESRDIIIALLTRVPNTIGLILVGLSLFVPSLSFLAFFALPAGIIGVCLKGTRLSGAFIIVASLFEIYRYWLIGIPST